MPDKYRLKRMIFARQFALLELGLYLNTHPDDCTALKLRAEQQTELARWMDEYEQCYGKLILTQDDVPADQWCWINDPWPWDCQKEA